MQTLLTQHRDPDLRSYWIWGRYLQNDTEAAARQNAARYVAPNGVHYWTPTQLLAEDLASVLRLPQGRLAWDVYLLYGRGLVWESRFPRPTYWQHQLGILQGESMDVNVLDGRILEALRNRPH